MPKNKHVLLEKKVHELYRSEHPDRDEWADWIFDGHVLYVADEAEKLAKRFGGIEPGLARAAGLLHDVADAVMGRRFQDEKHREATVKITKELMTESGYDVQEIDDMINDALRFHGCRDGERPKTVLGKILATADAIAHIDYDFYLRWTAARVRRGENYDDVRVLLTKKLARDYHDKILFPEIARELEAKYNFWRETFEQGA